MSVFLAGFKKYSITLFYFSIGNHFIQKSVINNNLFSTIRMGIDGKFPMSSKGSINSNKAIDPSPSVGASRKIDPSA